MLLVILVFLKSWAWLLYFDSEIIAASLPFAYIAIEFG